MPTIADLGTKRPKIDAEMTYLNKKNINEAIHQNMSKNNVYKSDMYNIIVVQTNEQLQEKVVS